MDERKRAFDASLSNEQSQEAGNNDQPKRFRPGITINTYCYYHSYSYYV